MSDEPFLPMSDEPFEVGDKVIVMGLAIDLLTEPVISGCPFCGHQSLQTAIGVLLIDDVIVHGPAEIMSCAEGCQMPGDGTVLDLT